MGALSVVFIGHDGDEYRVEAKTGMSLMEVGRDADIPNIVADCGGACACATCHVFVAPEWSEIVGPPGEAESEMLEFREDREPTSRLSCQIELEEALDELVVRVPESQY